MNDPFKTLVNDALKYNGPIFMRKKELPDKDAAELFRREERLCKVCGTVTRHERVRNLWVYYWRCEQCLDRQLRERGYYTPPFQSEGGGRYKDQFRKMNFDVFLEK